MGWCVLNWKTDLIKNPNISVPLTTLEACMKELPLPNSFGKLLWNCMAADAYFHEIPTSVDEIKESLSDLSEFFKHSFDVAGVKQRDVDQETLQKVQQLQKDWGEVCTGSGICEMSCMCCNARISKASLIPLPSQLGLAPARSRLQSTCIARSDPDNVIFGRSVT